MEAAFVKSFLVLLVLCLSNKGLCDCDVNTKLIVGTVRSGREIQGKPEWTVRVTNNCDCAQRKIRLACKGFNTVEEVDPSILSKPDKKGRCLLIHGNSLAAHDSISFSYAWDPPYIFWPRGSIADC